MITISLSLGRFSLNDGTESLSATQTAIHDPERWIAEAFFQLAQLLESEFRAERFTLVESLRAVADVLEKPAE